MALINDIYVWVESEDIDRSTNVPQHPVEKGLPLTDSVSNEPITLSISGTIVNTSSNTADEIISKLDKLRINGSLIKYTGRNYAGNYMITSFPTSHTKDVWGGANFSMELVEVRIAKSAYNPKAAKTEKQKNNPTLEVGATVVFTGGSVYVSSDAKKAAANRGRQTCKITKINTRSWAIHQYHLISTEKKYPYNVYGWVDKANIEGTGTTVTTSTTNAGTQQVKKTTKTASNKLLGFKGYTQHEIVLGESFTVVTINGIEYTKTWEGYFRRSTIKWRYSRLGNRWTTIYYIAKGTAIYYVI